MTAEEKKIPIISFFNHKGGVSKTTITFNLGWAISRKFRRAGRCR
jgi:chromosome partitioning protein